MYENVLIINKQWGLNERNTSIIPARFSFQTEKKISKMKIMM